jgi:hypothetical protein
LLVSYGKLVGKIESNVVDALKWVLGDMSPKSLRGKRMEDHLRFKVQLGGATLRRLNCC